MIAVSDTIKRTNKRTAQFSPKSVMCNQEWLQIIFPGWMNGWNMIIAPPNGSNINNRLNESIYDNLAIFNMTNNNISSIIGMKSSFETTQTTIIKIVDINFIRPSRLCIGLSCDAKSSNLIICVMSAINIPTIILKIHIILLFAYAYFNYFQLILKKSGRN